MTYRLASPEAAAYAVQNRPAHLPGRLRCHSRQSTGSASSGGPGSHRRTPAAPPDFSRLAGRNACAVTTRRMRRTATASSHAEAAIAPAKYIPHPTSPSPGIGPAGVTSRNGSRRLASQPAGNEIPVHLVAASVISHSRRRLPHEQEALDQVGQQQRLVRLTDPDRQHQRERAADGRRPDGHQEGPQQRPGVDPPEQTGQGEHRDPARQDHQHRRQPRRELTQHDLVVRQVGDEQVEQRPARLLHADRPRHHRRRREHHQDQLEQRQPAEELLADRGRQCQSSGLALRTAPRPPTGRAAAWRRTAPQRIHLPPSRAGEPFVSEDRPEPPPPRPRHGPVSTGPDRMAPPPHRPRARPRTNILPIVLSLSRLLIV